MWSSSLFWRKMGAITIHKLTWCSSTPWNLCAIDTEGWASKGQENKAKLNYCLSISCAYFSLFRSLLFSPLGKRAKLLYHVLQKKTMPGYGTNDDGYYTINSVLCNESQTKSKVKLKIPKSTTTNPTCSQESVSVLVSFCGLVKTWD